MLWFRYFRLESTFRGHFHRNRKCCRWKEWGTQLLWVAPLHLCHLHLLKLAAQPLAQREHLFTWGHRCAGQHTGSATIEKKWKERSHLYWKRLSQQVPRAEKWDFCVILGGNKQEIKPPFTHHKFLNLTESRGKCVSFNRSSSPPKKKTCCIFICMRPFSSNFVLYLNIPTPERRLIHPLWPFTIKPLNCIMPAKNPLTKLKE